jgi:hypothetical protein
LGREGRWASGVANGSKEGKRKERKEEKLAGPRKRTGRGGLKGRGGRER